MLGNFLQSIGASTLKFFKDVSEALYFSKLCVMHLFLPKSYHPAMQSVLLKQIYFTVVQILPSFLLIGILFGSLSIGYVISLAIEYGLKDQVGSILLGFTFYEFAPLFTALLIALRSGAAVNTEIAVMQVSGELNTLKKFDIGLIDYLFLPRIISGMISNVALSLLFAMLMLVGGYLFTLLYMNMNLQTYTYMLFHSVEIKHLIFLIGKSMAFGFVIMLIPIYSGLTTTRSFDAIPIAVLRGMVRLFIAIFTIEGVTFFLR
ncbi:MAG: ABC transporter permease [Campylobacterota bacterium]|nr:ABC transporter permease [Campylobacterota bacterium]